MGIKSKLTEKAKHYGARGLLDDDPTTPKGILSLEICERP